MNGLALLLLLFLQYDTPAHLLREGNTFYEAGDYSEAIALYEEAAEQTTHPVLFYNLGNSYFKKGKMGKAILNFRRAFFLAPRDNDISFNLAFARNYRVDKIKFEQGPFGRIIFTIFHFFSMIETQYLTAVFFLALSIFAAFFIIYRRTFFSYLALGSLSVCIFFFINWHTWTQEKNGNYAVVIVPEVSALSGPSEDYKEILLIHDGTEVKVQEKRGTYVLIKLPGGIGGWVPEDVLEEVYP